MRKLALLAVLFLSGNVLFAQTVLTGIVIDQTTAPVPFANVLLLNAADSVLAVGEITDEDGRFSVSTLSGNFLLLTSAVGYQDTEFRAIEVVAGKKKMDLGTIIISASALELETVEVTARRPLFEQKIDRLVVNVASSITSAGGSALDVLQRSPGVIINRQTNSISMSGKGGVVIQINGKESRLPQDALIQMLEGMNADNIETIELIHTPPASYDAQGNAGIINIVLKKNMEDGWNGNVSAFAGYGKREKFGGSINANYRRGKVNIYGDLGTNYNYNPQEFINYREVVQNGNRFINDNVSDRSQTQTYRHQGRLGLDYQLSEKTVIGILGSGFTRDWFMAAENRTLASLNGTQTDSIFTPNEETNDWRHGLANINFQHDFKEGERLVLDFDYAHYGFENPSFYDFNFFGNDRNQDSLSRLRINKVTPMNIWAGRLDFTRNLGDKIKLEAGGKLTQTRFENTILVEEAADGTSYATVPDFSNESFMEEDLTALYAAFAFEISEKTEGKAGLRYEHTDTEVGFTDVTELLVDRNYGNFFPSLFVAHTLTENSAINASYSRRIDRPGFNALAPFFIFYDPTTIGTGNPALQPALSDNYELSYRYKSFMVTVNYGRVVEAISGFQPIIGPNGTQVNQPINFDLEEFGYLDFSFPVRPAPWWEIQLNLAGGYQSNTNDDAGESFSQERFAFYGFGNSNFIMGRDWTAELSGWLYTGGLNGQAAANEIGELNFGLAKKLRNNQGTLRFSINDILLTGNWQTNITEPNLVVRSAFNTAERIFRVQYSRTFGSNSVKGNRQRSTGASDLLNRVN